MWVDSSHKPVVPNLWYVKAFQATQVYGNEKGVSLPRPMPHLTHTSAARLRPDLPSSRSPDCYLVKPRKSCPEATDPRPVTPLPSNFLPYFTHFPLSSPLKLIPSYPD
ncbi:hypothetical protein E2C01_013353 [Portunus trituberculatus]|uniref:Uncharacterized protein n=1 Tax=Portunus trituberculatus TaxID=210409 RepID=A0A5B7DGF1_PORTR|nr:hypothetical protein [Portunus trituberculatus]